MSSDNEESEKNEIPVYLPKFAPSSDTESSSSDDFVLCKSDDENRIQVAWPLARHLRRYQKQGVRFLFQRCFAEEEDVLDQKQRNHHGAILADDMGLGKTVQVISLMSAVLRKSQIESEDLDRCRYVRFGPGSAEATFLIICPGSVMGNWQDELETWGKFVSMKYHGSGREKEKCLKLAKCDKLEVVLTTFETARDSIEELNGVKWDCVVADEVHKLKEPSSKVTKALKRLDCRYRIGLTGTPLQNKYEELWCILDWANPGCLGSYQSFTQNWARKIGRGLRIDATKGELSLARKLQKDLDEMKIKWILRRTKDKTIRDQMPKKEDKIVFCLPTKVQMKVLKSFRNHEDMRYIFRTMKLCDCGRRKKAFRCCYKTNPDGTKSWPQIVFTFLHLYLKACNHIALLKSVKEADAGLGYCQFALQSLGENFHNFLEMSDPKFSGKMKVLSDLLEIFEREKSKVLLFSYSTALLDILESFVQSKSYEYSRLDGKTKMDSRMGIVKNFNTNPDIFLFLISTKAGGLGLNITGANVVIIFDPNWNPSHDIQAQDRAYRIGQTKDVRVYRLITSGSIEENIYLRQVYKQQLGKNAIDGENARRYFTAVHGQANGELFGIRNLFSVRDGDSLTSSILKRHDDVERVVRGIDIRDDMLEQTTTPGCDERDQSEAGNDFNDLIAEEIEVMDRNKTIDEVLRSRGVVHHHLNQNLIGGSRVEDHISEFAQKRIVDNQEQEGLSQEPVLMNCDIIQPTQDLLATQQQGFENREEEHDQMELLQPCTQSRKLQNGGQQHLVLRANNEKIIRTDTCTYFYGQTPQLKMEADFEKLARYLDRSLEETAKFVLSLSNEQKVDVLKEFYEHLDYPQVGPIYTKLKDEMVQEERELLEFKLNQIPDDDKIEDFSPNCANNSDSETDIKSSPQKRGQTFSKLKKIDKRASPRKLKDASSIVAEISTRKRKPPPDESYKRKHVTSVLSSEQEEADKSDDEEVKPVVRERKPPPEQVYKRRYPTKNSPNTKQNQKQCGRESFIMMVSESISKDETETGGEEEEDELFEIRRKLKKPPPEESYKRKRFSEKKHEESFSNQSAIGNSCGFYENLLLNPGKTADSMGSSLSSSSSTNSPKKNSRNFKKNSKEDEEELKDRGSSYDFYRSIYSGDQDSQSVQKNVSLAKS